MHAKAIKRFGMARRLAVMLGILFVLLVIAAFRFPRDPQIKALFQQSQQEDHDNAEEVKNLKAASLSVATTSESSTGWPQWRGPQRDGRAPAGPFRTDWDREPPKVLWEIPSGLGFGSFAVTGGKLYIHDNAGTKEEPKERLRCLDAATGASVWEYVVTADYSSIDKGFAPGPRATVAVDGNRVYTVGATGLFLCVQAPDAPGGQPRELWRHDFNTEFEAKSPGFGVACSPLIEGDLVIVQPGGKRRTVAAFDKLTGELRWAAGDQPSGYSSPMPATIDGKRIIFGMTANAHFAVRADGTGFATYKWITNTGENVATPIVVGEYVFISSSYNHGCALLRVKPEGEQIKFEEVYVRINKVMRNHHSTSVYFDGYLYGFDDTVLRCVDFRRGRVKEDWEAERIQKGCLILVDKYLLVFSENGDVSIVEATPEEFRLVAKRSSGLDGGRNWALPVLVDGRLYLRGSDKIVCWDVK